MCTIDPFCCEFAWDAICAVEANAFCDAFVCGDGVCSAGEQCADCPADCGACAGGCDPTSGSCFEVGGEPGCEIVPCCEAVCTINPSCCGTGWNAACVELAMTICFDCNGNGVPDNEDICTGTELDCNFNGVPDDCDVAFGASEDSDGNGIPDECQDCNGNGVFDPAEIESDDAKDCNQNAIPDDCEEGSCCVTPMECAISTIQLCEEVGGIFRGPCLDCPEQTVALILEGDGEVFVHVIGPPVECIPQEFGMFCIPGEPLIDPWESPENANMCHAFGVTGSPAIPADFFGPGSDPFVGAVCLVGKPLQITEFGNADTLVARSADPFDRCDPTTGISATVTIDVFALSLESVAPVSVTYDGGQASELWDVAVDLSEIAPPSGTLTATKTYCNGGVYISTLFIQPRFTFTKINNPADIRVLDTGLSGIPPVTLAQTDPLPWVHDIDGNFGVMGDVCSVFHPGVIDLDINEDCDCNGNLIRDKCDIENLISADCNENDVPDECDVAQGTSTDVDGNGVLDECEELPPGAIGLSVSGPQLVPQNGTAQYTATLFSGDAPPLDVTGLAEWSVTPGTYATMPVPGFIVVGPVPDNALVIVSAAYGVFSDDMNVVLAGDLRDDLSPPILAITQPTNLPTYQTESPTITLEGLASGEQGVASVAWNLAGGPESPCTGTSSWTCGPIALSPGLSVLTVTATDPSGLSAAAVLTVTFDADGAPKLAAAPNTIDMGLVAELAFIEVWNSGTGSLIYNFRTDRDWMTVDPATGSSAGVNERNTHTLTVDRSLLEPGIFETGHVTIGDIAGTLTPITIAVFAKSADTPGPIPAVSQTALEFDPKESIRTLEVWNAGIGVLSYAIESDEPWLSVEPGSAASSGSEDVVTHTVEVDRAELPLGTTATATLMIVSDGGATPPLVVTVLVSSEDGLADDSAGGTPTPPADESDDDAPAGATHPPQGDGEASAGNGGSATGICGLFGMVTWGMILVGLIGLGSRRRLDRY
ncbi:MAG: hypothetical protein IID36_10970 [Planctomycetes bacterium]|nr:hypothetical protein [Planctomycetota bacterium]